jgi:hypothetical protein
MPHLAAGTHGLPVLGVALSFTAFCAWAARRGLLHASVPGGRPASSGRRFAARSAALAAAIGAEFLSAVAALAAQAVIAAYCCVPRPPSPLPG